VTNNSGVDFTGLISQHIETEQGVYVEGISDVFVADLAAGAQINLPALWNTQYFFAGNYKVVSQLLDENDIEQDAQQQPFTILPDQINGSIASLNIVADRQIYNSIDDVVLATTVSNLSANAILANTRAQVLLSQPDNMIVFQNISAVNNLSPNTSQSWQHQVAFNNVPTGDYLATFNLVDENDVIIASTLTTFTVVRDDQQFITATVTALLPQVDTFTDNSCSYSVQNTDTLAINNIEVQQIIVNLVTQEIILQDTTVINLGANELWNNDQFIETFNLNTNAYACILRTIIAGELQTRGTAVFNVIGFNHLTGFVWDDNNGNGLEDGIDFRLENAQLRLLDNNQNEIEVINTLADGSYEFTPVADGQYSIEVLETGVLAGYVLTTANSPLSFSLNGNNVVNNFGYQSHNSVIVGFVFADDNGNGNKDGNENFIQGISIALTDTNNTVLATTSSNAQGIYQFNQLLATTYRVVVTDDLGILIDSNLTTANQPYETNLIANQIDNTPRFGYQYHDSSITGLVFDDLNGDGLLNNAEVGMGNVSIELTGNNQTSTFTTGSNGIFLFEQLFAGDYQISITDSNAVLTGFQLTTANQPYVLALNIHENNTNALFGYQAHLSIIAGKVFKDDSGDGIQDVGESNYSNVSISLVGNNISRQLNTLADGSYSFDQLATGDYTVTVTDTNSVLTNTQLTTANQPYQLNLGTQVLDNNGVFGYQLHNSSLSGILYSDSNGNGTQDNSETGLQGVSMDLTDSTGQLVTSISSQNAGVYSFTQRVAGDYQIVVTDVNSVLTQAQLTTANQPFNTTLAENDDQTGIDFGYQFTRSGITGLVFNDINGNGIQDSVSAEPGLQNVSIELFKDSVSQSSTDTSTTGIYQFESLAQGHYRIIVTDNNGVLTDADLTSANQPYELDLAENEQHTNGVFAYQYHRSNIVIEIFNDSNGNGQRDSGEAGIGQVTASITRDSTTIPAAASDNTGQIQLNNLIAADYLIDIDDSNNILGNYQLTTANLPLSINLGDNQTDNSALFGYQLTNSAVTGLFFNDINGDGLAQNGESGLANISLTLNKDQQIIRDITSQTDGSFAFNKLPAGAYEIIVSDDNQILTDAQLTSANLPFVLNLADNQNIDNAIFAYQFSQSSITGIIFNDLNGDGTQQSNEPGFDNVTVDLIQNNQVQKTTFSTVAGVYLFNQLTAGAYTIIVSDTNNILAETQLTSNNQPYNLQLGDNQQHNGGNFAYQFINASILATVFDDINTNGVQDGNEQGIANITVDLLKSGQLQQQKITLNDGSLNFNQLSAGDYQLLVTDDNSLLGSATLTTNNQPYDVTLSAGQQDVAAFGYQNSTASISGLIWHDANANGQQDSNESGLLNITAELRDDTQQIVASVTTNDNGIYNINQLSAGQYQLLVPEQTSIAGWQLTTAENPVAINLSNAENVNQNIGFRSLNSSVSGHVFNDENGNGIHENNEGPMPDIEMQLFQQNSNRIGNATLITSVSTDPQGDYSIAQLPIGEYYLHVVQPPAYQISPQGNDSEFNVFTGNTRIFGLNPSDSINFGLGLTQQGTALLKKPKGIKHTAAIDENTIRWYLDWYNLQNSEILSILVNDQLAQGSHYKRDTLHCTVHGDSSISRCNIDTQNNIVVVQADIVSDANNSTASNYISVSFDVILDPELETIENQGRAYWDANNDGQISDEINNGQIPVLSTDQATQTQTPTKGYVVIPVPLFKLWQIALLMLLLLMVASRYKGSISKQFRGKQS
jgi:hypothetical protein